MDTFRTNLRVSRAALALGLLATGLLVLWCRPCGLRAQEADAKADPDTDTKADDLKRRLEQLRSVPYTSVTSEKVDPRVSGVTIYGPELVYDGYNLYWCELCPDVMLMDMKGEVVHHWKIPDDADGKGHHVIMLPNGDVVALTKSTKSLVRFDWDSNPVWQKRLECHHDLVLSPDSTLYVIVDETYLYRDILVKFPAIVELTLDGEETGKWSARLHLDEIKQAFDKRSFLDTIMDSLLARKPWAEVREDIKSRVEASAQQDGSIVFDYFHMNTINVLPETPIGEVDDRFRAGNLLLCFKHVNQIAVLDRDTKEILWVWGEGVLQWPHHPTMLESGNILIFDNGIWRRSSTILELNPVTEAVEWEYTGNPPESFYSYSRGSAQRLPNGNTLICEADLGRAFEITADGRIVWEWLNPLVHQDSRGQVYRMERLSPEIVRPLLSGK
jgi:hypothetical protein